MDLGQRLVNVEVKQLNKVTLSRGVRIAVTAVDADSGARLTDHIYVISAQKDLDQVVDRANRHPQR